MNLNRKGFTLIELLVTIAIIALVLGFSVFGIVKVINSSKEQKTVLNVQNLKEAARIYSVESDSDSWKKTNEYDAFCVTVGELMNKGLLDKNGIISDKNISRDTYIIVKRNNVTMATYKEEITMEDDKNYNICTDTNNIPGEDVVKPKINDSVSYTDKIEISFSSGSASLNGNPSSISYRCLFGESSSNVNREGSIEGNKCILDKLKENKDYYVLLYINTNNGSSVVAEGNRNYKTSDFNVPNFNQDKNVITITYNDKDTNGHNINNVSHYFKSTVQGTSNKNVRKCTSNNNIFTCDNSTNTIINKDTWYRVDDTTINISYPEENNTVMINARVYDGSNNYKEKEDSFTIKKHVIRFYKNTALSIDGSTDEYIEKYCISTGSNSCKITSPVIVASTGYTGIGWNTSSNATSSTWNSGAEKDINKNGNYYAIVNANTYTISYNENGGSGTPSSQTKTYGIDLNLTTDVPTRTGYTFTGWNIASDGSGTSYASGASYTANASATLYAQWSENTLTVVYHSNGANSLQMQGTAITETQLVNNYKSAYKYATNNTSGLRNGDNSSGLYLTKTGHTFTKYWIVGDASGNLTSTKLHQGTEYSGKTLATAAGTSIDSGNATIHVYAQWTANTYTINYTYNGGTAGTNAPASGTYNTDVQISNPTKTVKVTGNANSTGATVGNATSKAQTFAGWTSNSSAGLGSNAKTGTASNPSTAWSGSATQNTYFRNLRDTSGTITLTANWTAVAFNLPTVTKTGNTCKWNTKSDGSGTSYASGASYTPSATSAASVTMYAVCTKNTYTVTFNANGGSDGPSSQTKTYGVDLTLTKSMPTKSGYTFIAWNTSADRSGVDYLSGGTYSNNANITLYAQWQDSSVKCYKITESSGLNCRSGPGTSYSIKTAYSQGSILKLKFNGLDSTGRSWYYYSGNDCYVSGGPPGDTTSNISETSCSTSSGGGSSTTETRAQRCSRECTATNSSYVSCFTISGCACCPNRIGTTCNPSAAGGAVLQCVILFT